MSLTISNPFEGAYRLLLSVLQWDHKWLQPTSLNLSCHTGNTLRVFVFAIGFILLYEFLFVNKKVLDQMSLVVLVKQNEHSATLPQNVTYKV